MFAWFYDERGDFLLSMPDFVVAAMAKRHPEHIYFYAELMEEGMYARSSGKYEAEWVYQNRAGERWSTDESKWISKDVGGFNSWLDSDLADWLMSGKPSPVPEGGIWVNINEA